MLRTASADLNEDGELPPLPAFPGQEPKRSPERPPLERFTVGTETFFWTPFPPPPPGRGGDSGSSDLVLSAVRGHTRSPQQYAAPELRGTPSAEEQLSEEQPSQRQPTVDGATTLQSCPMCQVDFVPGLAQLDIDSHLAQCLADSTDDIEW